MKKYLYIVLIILGFLAACNSGGKTEAPEANAQEEKPPEQKEPAKVPPEKNNKGLTKEQRVSDSQMIVGLLERGYAPREWKEKALGISFSKNSEALLSRAAEDISDTEFYEAVGKYLSGFHDSHVSYSFPSTLVARLPFNVRNVEGKVVVSNKCDQDNCNISRGDELIAINGRSAFEIRDELKPLVGHGNPQTELDIATIFITHRPQRRFPSVPEGDATVTIRSHSDGSLHDINLKWIRTGYPLAQINDRKDNSSKAISRSSYVSGDKIDTLEEIRDHSIPKETVFVASGNAEADLPFFDLGGNFIERKKTPFYSGIIVAGSKNIGFLRIHSFSNDDVNFGDAFAELEEEINYFENNTDVLIIDQTYNEGGYLCFLMNIASMLFQKPIKEPGNQYRAIRERLIGFEEIAIDSNKVKEDKEISAAIAGAFRKAINGGELLTDPIYAACNLDGTFNPYTTKDGKNIAYTKPILLLINGWAASGGDVFPAILKDTGRAALFGTTTMGAGGIVKGIEQRIGYSEITIRYTVSLLVRAPEQTLSNGIKTHYIENVGVTPDIEYKITMNDFMSGYKNYRAAIEEAALSLIGENKGEGK